jgi:hypothetical protein
VAIAAWTLLRPNKSFAGFTLESFTQTVAPSLDLRKRVAESNANTRQLIARRDDANVLSKKALHRLVSGVQADAEEGPDSDLYAEMGYMRHAVRNSMLSARRAKAAELAAAKEAAKEETSLTRR